MFGVNEFHGVAVADNISVETVSVSQQLGEEIMRCAHRLAIPVVVAGHNFHRVCLLDDAAEGIKVEFVQFSWGDVRICAAVCVASTFGHAVCHIMLHARSYALLLYACGHLYAEFCYHEWILTVAFQGPAPALVASDVQDRRIDAVVTKQCRFFSRNAAGGTDQLAVPGGAYGYGGGKGSGEGVIEAMYAFVGELHGDAKAGVLDKPLLHGIQGIYMVGEGIDVIPVSGGRFADTVEMLVYVRQSVFPDFILPGLVRERIFQDPSCAI